MTCYYNDFSFLDNLCITYNCAAPQCPVPIIEDGTVILRGSPTGTTASFQCSTRNSMQETRKCLSSGQWSGEVPTCKQERGIIIK